MTNGSPSAPTAPVSSRSAQVGERSKLAVTVAVVLAAISLFWMASEQHYQSCVQKAQAQFPAIPVSALTGRQTGPLKVSYVRERASALDDCGRFF